MNPTDQYVKKYADLFTHIEDKDYVKRAEEFSRWYEAPLDLPGVYYLQAVEWLFKENRLAKGNFVALGKTHFTQGHYDSGLHAGWRSGRHHAARASVQCRKLSRHAKNRHGEKTGARWTYRPVHGEARLCKNMARNQQMDFVTRRLRSRTMEHMHQDHTMHTHSQMAMPVADATAIYTCPMHPQVRHIGPGSCPICGMTLEPVNVALSDKPIPNLST